MISSRAFVACRLISVNSSIHRSLHLWMPSHMSPDCGKVAWPLRIYWKICPVLEASGGHPPAYRVIFTAWPGIWDSRELFARSYHFWGFGRFFQGTQSHFLGEVSAGHLQMPFWEKASAGHRRWRTGALIDISRCLADLFLIHLMNCSTGTPDSKLEPWPGRDRAEIKKPSGDWGKCDWGVGIDVFH